MTSRRSSRAERRMHLGVADPVDGGGRDEGEPAPDPDDETAHRRVDLPVGPAGHDVVQPADLLAGLVPDGAAQQAGQRHDGVEDAFGREDATRPAAALVRRAFRSRGNGPGSNVSGSARSSTVAWPWSYLLWRPRVEVRIGCPAARCAHRRISERRLPPCPARLGAQAVRVARISDGTEWGMRRLFYWGVRPSTWPHLLLRRPCAGGLTPTIPAAHLTDLYPGQRARHSVAGGSTRQVPCLSWT